MQPSIYILFFILTQTIFGQTIYEPFFINQCTKKLEKGVIWYLADSTKTYGMENLESKPVELSKAGPYKLYVNFDNPPIAVEITSNKTNRDTIFLKNLDLDIYVSNPPHSEYFDCGKLANGEVLDFYSNGNLRTKGTFKEGQPIDTLFEYHRNSKLSELFIPSKKWKRITYFDNGNLKSVYDTKKRLEKEYYQNGQLKKEEFWNKRHIKSTEFDKNGNVIKTVSKKEQKKFNKNGIVTEKITRKEILVFDRIFAKNKYDRNNKFYEYKWDTFDENGTIKRKVIFNSNGFLMSAFPDSLKQIDKFLFEKVLFYKNGEESKKIELNYVFENNKSVKKILVFRKEDDNWIKEKTTTANNVYKQLGLE
jgi:antitoxin component YwqK of YwqJK toxin-antitoxin module